MALKAVRWEVMDWIHLTVYKNQWWIPLNMAMNLQVP
jgi:hypothetical protein